MVCSLSHSNVNLKGWSCTVTLFFAAAESEAGALRSTVSLFHLSLFFQQTVCPADCLYLSVFNSHHFGNFFPLRNDIDNLVNNSGATWGAPTEDYPIEGWKKVINVNVTGTFLCSQIIGKIMITNGGGKIVNVSSIYGGVGCKSEVMDAIAYNTSKGAMDQVD